MALIRAQVRLPYFTNLPEDVATNTMYFITAGVPATEGELDDIAARIGSFYAAFDENIAAIVSRSVDAVEIRMYDMADPEPRVPVRTDNFQLAAPAGATNLPLEVSCVISFHAAFESGVPNARRRGRFYIGPLTSASANFGSATVMPAPHADLITKLVAGAVLLGTDVTEVVTWAQYSPTLGIASPVQGGWVDNEFDTQRRRQARSSARTTFLTPV
jgi:hypothetical protein